jgi:hypothetical protein
MAYKDEGYKAELEVFSSSLLAMDYEIRKADKEYDLTQRRRTKANVLYPSVHEFSKTRQVTMIARQVLGTKHVHCWDAMVWIKRAGDNKIVSAHQDATYWNFAPKHKAFTMWVPLQGVSAENGSIQYSPFSHLQGQRLHVDLPTDHNLLLRGQTVRQELAFTEPVSMAFGCASIHHPFMVHKSSQNDSRYDRYALNFMFVSYECTPILRDPMEYTMCVSGMHDGLNWNASPPPKRDDPQGTDIAWCHAHNAQRANYLRLR